MSPNKRNWGGGRRCLGQLGTFSFWCFMDYVYTLILTDFPPPPFKKKERKTTDSFVRLCFNTSPWFSEKLCNPDFHSKTTLACVWYFSPNSNKKEIMSMGNTPLLEVINPLSIIRICLPTPSWNPLWGSKRHPQALPTGVSYRRQPVTGGWREWRKHWVA